MPKLINAKKALRQNEKHAQRNKVIKAEIHSLRVKVRKALTSKQMDEAKNLVQLVGKKLDKALQKKIFKQNTVARYKSRLMKKLHTLLNAK
jgi:small subunit ribosomal protein S20